MARIPGVKFEKDAHGNKRYVRIDLKKHADTMAPVLEQLGAKHQSDEDAEREAFYKERAKGLTGDQLRAHLHKTIESLPWKK